MRILKTIPAFAKGCITSLLFTTLFLSFSSIIIITMSLTYLIPRTSWRYFIKGHLAKMTSAFYQLCLSIIKIFRLTQLHITSTPPLKKQGWYLIIANHSSWLDILAAGVFFNSKIPSLKFFMKKELLWTLPLGGLACYLADFPFIERANKSKIRKNPQLKNKDIKTTESICKKLMNYPTALIIFPEGTRFSLKKQQRQQSAFQHLLKPKSAGIATVINEMHDKLEGIIDLTLSYTPHTFSIWDFLCGKLKTIHIHYDVLPISDDWQGDYKTDRSYRIAIQKKLNERWQQKDSILQETFYDQS